MNASIAWPILLASIVSIVPAISMRNVHNEPVQNQKLAMEHAAIPRFSTDLKLTAASVGLQNLNTSYLWPILRENYRQNPDYDARIKAFAAMTHCQQANTTACSFDNAILVAGSDPTAAQVDWSRIGHALYTDRVISRRRNYAMLLDASRHQLISVGRHYLGDVETFNLDTNERRRYPSEYLNTHHVGAVLVDAINPSTAARLGYQELWVVCGAQSEIIEHETMIKQTRITDMRTMTTRLGPAIDIPRVGCGAMKLNYTNVRGIELELICSIGGSVGTHRNATFVRHSACYDRVLQQWVRLPDMIQELDHHNVGIIDYQQCPLKHQQEHGGPTYTLVIFNGRPKAYGQPTSMVYELPLEEAFLASGMQRRPTPQYAESVLYDETQARSAGGGVVVSGRYLVSVGGLRHAERICQANIVIVDMCTKRTCIPPIGHIVHHFGSPVAWDPASDTIHMCAGQVIGSPLFKYFDADTRSLPRDIALSRSISVPYCEVWSMQHLLQTCENTRWHESLLNTTAQYRYA